MTRIQWRAPLIALLLLGAVHARAFAQRDSLNAVFERGLAALSERRLDAAIADFRRCLELSPHHPDCAYNLACAFSLKRDFPHAIAWLDHAADWGFENVQHMVADSDLVSVRTQAGFWRVVDDIQRRLPGNVRRSLPAPDPERGQELVVMLRSELGSGAGIIVAHDSARLYVVTADHVVRRGAVTARTIDAQVKALTPQWQRARLLPARPDTSLDLAILAIDNAIGGRLRFCDLPVRLAGSSADLRRGAKVFPVGYPGGILWAMPLSADQVSQVLPSQISFESQFIRVGFSGGALLNERGEVVGMITADEPPLARALPIEIILDAVRRAGYPTELGGGEPDAPWPLHAAAKSGDVVALKRLLGSCADPNAVAKDGRTPLHEAVLSGSAQAVRMLLAAGARRNAWAVLDTMRGVEWGTPLHFAARYATRPVAQALLDTVDVELETLWRYDDERAIGQLRTALHVAAQYDRPDVAEALLAAGARQDSLNSPLSVAAAAGALATARVLIERGARVNAGDHQTPLMRAAEAGHADMLKLLIARGAALEAKGGRGTALHYAADAGKTDAVAVLLASKATVNARGYLDSTPLHMAAEQGSAAVVKMLIDGGADVNAVNERGETPLSTAVWRHRTEVVKLLAAAHAEIGSALHQVLSAGDASAARALIEAGADVQLKDGDERQPLHIAAAKGLTEIVALLLEGGAPVNTVDRPYDKNTPLHLAAEAGHDSIVAMLISAGAPVNARDNSGGTPLYRAARGGHNAIVARLLRAGADTRLTSDYDRSHYTVVGIAADKAQPDLLALLLRSGADPDYNGDGYVASPLSIAAGDGRIENVRLLLQAKAKVTAEPGASSALHAAARNDTTGQIIRMLLDAGSPVDWKGEDEKTPLHIATEELNLAGVKLLLAAGASAAAADECGETPLWKVVRSRSSKEDRAVAVAEALFAAGADANVRSTCTQRTLLDLAAASGYLKLQRLLTTRGARPSSN